MMVNSLFFEIWMEKWESVSFFSTIRMENMDFFQRLDILERHILSVLEGAKFQRFTPIMVDYNIEI